MHVFSQSQHLQRLHLSIIHCADALWWLTGDRGLCGTSLMSATRGFTGGRQAGPIWSPVLMEHPTTPIGVTLDVQSRCGLPRPVCSEAAQKSLHLRITSPQRMHVVKGRSMSRQYVCPEDLLA